MEEKINISEILKDKPKGIKLYSTAFGQMTYDDLAYGGRKIWLLTKNEIYKIYYSDGIYRKGGEVTLFPSKEMRNWSKFAWKRGDVLVSNDGCTEVIFDKWYDDTYTSFYCKHYLDSEDENDIRYLEEFICSTWKYSLEDTESFLCYVTNIEERLGGKLNFETLEIEKHQEFKDGDILSCDEDTYTKHTILIFHKDGDIKESIVSLVRHSKLVEDNEPIDDFFLSRLYYAREDEKKELFDALAKEGKAWDADKKMIVNLKPKIELKPFDKVLVRDGKNEIWEPAFFFRNLSHLNVYNYQTVGGESRVYCIPFNEETAKLIGTTDDWEG